MHIIGRPAENYMQFSSVIVQFLRFMGRRCAKKSALSGGQTINKVSVGVSIVPGGVYAGNEIAPPVRILVALSVPLVSAPHGNP